MADVITGVTETQAAALANISNQVQEFLIQQSVLLPFATDYSALAVKGASSIKVPRSGGFTVNSKSENTAIDAQALTYSADTISLDQHRVIQFLIEKIADKQAVPAIVEDQIMKATRALALDFDEKIIAELRLASSSSPDHELVFNDTSNNDLELVDLLEGRRLLQVQDVPANEIVVLIGPDKEKDAFQLEQFVDASRFGSNEIQARGQLGRVYGMNIITHSSLTSEMIMFHPSAVGYAIQQPTELDMDKDLGNLAMRYSLDYIAGFEVLDAGVRNVHFVHT